MPPKAWCFMKYPLTVSWHVPQLQEAAGQTFVLSTSIPWAWSLHLLPFKSPLVPQQPHTMPRLQLIFAELQLGDHCKNISTWGLCWACAKCASQRVESSGETENLQHRTPPWAWATMKALGVPSRSSPCHSLLTEALWTWVTFAVIWGPKSSCKCSL